MRGLIAAVVLLASGRVFAGELPAPPAFTKKPEVSRAGDLFKIEFAVSRESDVAVYIENAKGEIVRHLVAGVLGKNPPEPLKAGLAQRLEWDGTDDDGKPAVGGPFSVRVGLGLKASWGGVAFADKEKSGPNRIEGVLGLATGPAGRLYVITGCSAWLYWGSSKIHVFRRDGSYEKTIKPFPSNLPLERLKGTGAFQNDRGYLNPLIHHALGMNFYPYGDDPAAQMAVTPDGRLMLTVIPTQGKGRGDTPGMGEQHLAAIDLDGSISMPSYAGPLLGTWGFGKPFMALSSDGKSVFITGFGRKPAPWTEPVVLPFVVRVKLPECGPAEPFFGDAKQIGNDNTHLNNPRGLAMVGQGNLLVCDFGSNRLVALKEADGSFVGSLSVQAPEWVGVHPKTGAVYVRSGENVIKFSNWKDGKEVSRLSLKGHTTASMSWGGVTVPLCFALDASAEPAVLWVGKSATSNLAPSPTLLRSEDRGESFSELEPAKCFPCIQYPRPASDPTHRLVLCGSQLLDEATGQTRKVAGEGQAVGNGQGSQARLDRDGNIYASQAEGGLWKCVNGKREPFPATADDPKLKGHLPAGSTGTTAWERDHYVDRKGDIYAKVWGTQYHGLMHVAVFAPNGALKRTALWGVSDGSYGPRVDARGNLYIMEGVKPAGQPIPEEFKPYVTDKWVQHWYEWIYGSIVKFSPAGGNIWIKNRSEANKPKAEPVTLPETLPKVTVNSTFRGDDNQMQGALWMVPGVAHVGDLGTGSGNGGEHCHCTGCDFDVDDFGRCFAPDNGRQRVTILDTNGNVILYFGAYGNQDYCGPESYVMDPKEKFLRPRKADDPKDLASPFAEPEIGFAWIVGLAVTDRHAYVDDVINKRVLRVKLEYHVEEKVPLRDVPGMDPAPGTR